MRLFLSSLNTLRPRKNGRHFADNIFTCIFLNENEWIFINILLNFFPKGQINNIPALVQIMAWRRPGDKPLSEPMMFSLLTHICITWPQWVKLQQPVMFQCRGMISIVNKPLCFLRKIQQDVGQYSPSCTMQSQWVSPLVLAHPWPSHDHATEGTIPCESSTQGKTHICNNVMLFNTKLHVKCTFDQVTFNMKGKQFWSILKNFPFLEWTSGNINNAVFNNYSC